MRTTFPEMVQRARVNLCCGPVGDIPETRHGSLRAVQRSYRQPTGRAKFPNFWIDGRRLESARRRRVPLKPNKQRKALIEPVFGHTKFNRRIERFQLRGLAACRSEWRLIAATHNLTNLYRHQLAAATA
jgi:hypothetical protein